MLIDIPLVVRFFYIWSVTKAAPEVTLMMILLCSISSIQLILFAMLFDMESNRELK
jgi:hypothetical protein